MLRQVTSPDGVTIASEVSGEGPPVVLVHGAGSARWSFDMVRPELESSFKVMAIDRRGRGDSSDAQGYRSSASSRTRRRSSATRATARCSWATHTEH